VSTEALVLSGEALLMLGAVASLIAARRRALAGWLAFAAVVGASFPLFAAALRGLFAPSGPVTLLVLPWLGAGLTLEVDPLSGLFLAIATAVALASALFSVRYMDHFERDGVAKFYPVLLVFVAAMVGVLTSADMLCFLVFWELMTLASFVLVTYERERGESQRAGLKYFVITHAATLCMLAAVLLLWRHAGSFSLADLGGALAWLVVAHPFQAHLALLLFFLGFATKAGVLPMGDWLPDAHPVAPSGVSALLSGALVKLGIYGLVRVFCEMLPTEHGARAWGTLIALAGAASLFVGTLAALQQSDSKRLMAFHTIGQIGYVCLGLGTGIALLPDHPGVAAVALAGGLLHAVNHACFKACLFLGAGAVLYRTGERDMNRLGGLGPAMPTTGFATAVASLSIAGVPPLNGFTSKWLIVCGCLAAGLDRPLFVLLGLVAMFVSLVTLASFLKLLGAVFLGPADPARRSGEVPASMVAPQVALAALCVLFGLVPWLPLRAVTAAAAAVAPKAFAAAPPLEAGPLLVTVAPAGVTIGLWAPLAVAAALSLFATACWVLQRAGGGAVRRVPVWRCGEEDAEPLGRYLASSYYVPFKHAFAGIYPRVAWRLPPFPRRLRHLIDIDAWLYRPAASLLERTARVTSRTHVGVPQVYLVWIVAGAIMVMAVLLAAAG